MDRGYVTGSGTAVTTRADAAARMRAQSARRAQTAQSARAHAPLALLWFCSLKILSTSAVHVIGNGIIRMKMQVLRSTNRLGTLLGMQIVHVIVFGS